MFIMQPKCCIKPKYHNCLDDLKRHYMTELKKAQENNNKHNISDTDTDSVISTGTVAAETAGIDAGKKKVKIKMKNLT